jgi:integrase
VDGIRALLNSLGAPTAYAWRRGWAVDALRHGVPQTSVQAAAGWANGQMVSRYTTVLASELSIENFQRRWAVS